MEILLIHSILQAQFREDLNDLLTKEFKLKEDKDVVFDFHKHSAYKGEIEDVQTLSRKVKQIVEGNYYFDTDDKMIMYYIEQTDKGKPKLNKKKII